METVGSLLPASGLPLLEARALLAHVLGTTREALVARPERAVGTDAMQRFGRAVARRRRGEPLAYVLGQKEFYGQSFMVDPAVLVPRPETELLVELALARLRGAVCPRVLDLGTGSGCIAISLALTLRAARITATDASEAALDLARRNAAHHRARVEFAAGDWFAAIDGRFDLIVSNPPYVAQGDPHLEDLRFEPDLALTAGADGLDCLRVVVAGTPAHLNPGGWLLLEHGHDQAAAVREELVHAGLGAIFTARDAAGIERVSGGRLGFQRAG